MAVVAAGATVALVAMAADRQTASLVFGQVDFYKNAPNLVDAAGMASPRAVAIDTASPTHHVWVADTGNSRVLGWNDESAYVSGAAADIVIGQGDFLSAAANQGGAPGAATLSSPAGVAVDRLGNLYISDSGNNRVMVFSAPLSGFSGAPIAGAAASAVFGQGGNFQTNGGCAPAAVSSATLCQPEGIALDPAGNLFVADAGDNRVLGYFTPMAGAQISPPADTSADLIFGQSDGSGSACNQGGGTATAATLCFEVGGAPFGSVGVTTDGAGNLFVTDSGNSRALEYTGPFGASQIDSTAARLVFSETNLSEPSGVAVDGAGNLYIAWNQGGEIRVYEDAVGGPNTLANLTIGPGVNNPSSGSFLNLGGLAIDGAANLYVADTGNNRVLEFNEGTSFGTTTASRALGQPDFAHGAVNRVDGAGLAAPAGLAIGMAGAQTAVYVADTQNNRVLGWIGPAAPAIGAADIVIGQSDFISSQPNAGAGEGATTLSAPIGAATDSSGNLFVADSRNNRVLEFADPAAACGSYPCVDSAPAIAVFGTCGSFKENVCAPPGTVSATSLFNPSAVAFDRVGDLLVSDSGNSRVLEFKPPFAAAPAAFAVFGQDGSFSTIGCNPDGVSAMSLCAPGGIATDSAGDLFVADTDNNRVLEFAAPFLSSPQASVVFGQNGSFTSNIPDVGGASSATLYRPGAVALDSRGNLYVADAMNNRVLEFAPPYIGAPAAIAVFGQSGMSAIDPNLGIAPEDLDGLGPDSLFAPAAIAVDDGGDLYVADLSNNRVLMYPDPPPSPTPSATATPTATSTATPAATPSMTATATATPSATATQSATATITPTATPTPVAEKLRLSPARVNFETVLVGKTRSKTVTIFNKKSKHAIAVIIEGVDPPGAPFTIVNRCGGELAPGQRCAIVVTFEPTASGHMQNKLVIRDNATGAPQSISIAATGKGLRKN